jgi:hypothetical protein
MDACVTETCERCPLPMGACVIETCARVESIYSFVLAGLADANATLTIALQLTIAAWFRIIVLFLARPEARSGS